MSAWLRLTGYGVLLGCMGCNSLLTHALPDLAPATPQVQVAQVANAWIFSAQGVGTLQVAPAYAAANTNITIAFSGASVLAAPPAVHVGNTLATPLAASDGSYTYVYTARGNETPGRTAIVLDGNTAHGVGVRLSGYVVFDFETPTVGAPTPEPSVTGYVGGVFSVSAPVSDDQNVVSCRVCTLATGCSDGGWAVGSVHGGACWASNLTCNDGDSLQLQVQATDNAGNVGNATPVPVICDAAPPQGSQLQLPDNGTLFVPGMFDVQASFSDGRTGLVSCEVCVGVGDCEGWAPATLNGNTCMATALSCTDTTALSVAMRAFDAVGNVGAITVHRTCDASVASVGAVHIAAPATATLVPANFVVTAPFGDGSGAGLVGCDVCVGSGGTCTAWHSAALSQNGTCSSPQTCTDGTAMTLSMRATDAVGNVGITATTQRTCDAVAPVLSNLALQRAGMHGLQLAWSTVEAGGLATAPYALAYGTAPTFGGSGATEGSSPVSVTTSPTQLSNLSGCHRYYVQVTATDSVGNVSAPVATDVTQGCGPTGALVAPGVMSGTTWTAAMVAADFNLDGAMDLAAAKPVDEAVRVRLGDVDASGAPLGTLNTVNVNYPLGNGNTVGIVAADLNGDGVLDLATCGLNGGVNVLLGSTTNNVADGNMVVQNANYAAGSSAAQIVAVDVNNDQNTDILVVSPNDRTLYTLLGNGNGTFQAARTTPVGTAWALAVADFNGDHMLDVVTTDSSGNGAVDFLQGSGNGTFAPMVSYPATAATGAANPLSVSAVDVNSDAVLDLLVANSGTNTVSVLLGRGNNGKGTGLFMPPVDFPTANAPVTVVARDMNGDGVPDAVVAHNGQPAVGVMLMGTDANNYGTGILAAEASVDTGYPGPAHQGLVVADINRDGILDAVVAVSLNYSSSLSFVIVSGAGSNGVAGGTWLPARAQNANASMRQLMGADLNRDGIVDLVGIGTSGLTTLLASGSNGRGVGAFGAMTMAPSLSGYGVLADWNNDGILDVSYGSTSVTVSTDAGQGNTGRGNGWFSAHVDTTLPPGSAAWWLHAADMDNDGSNDLVVADASGKVQILLGAGGPPITVPTPGMQPLWVGSADFNRDGWRDLVVTSISGSSNNVCLLLATGSWHGGPAFSPCVFANAGNGPESSVIADFNADGLLDVASSNYNDGTLSVLLGTGSAGRATALQNGTAYSVGPHPTFVQAVDINQDTVSDLVVTDDNGVAVLVGNKTAGHGNGTFTVGPRPAVAGPGGLVVTDVDADGVMDVVVSVPAANSIDILYGAGTYAP